MHPPTPKLLAATTTAAAAATATATVYRATSNLANNQAFRPQPCPLLHARSRLQARSTRATAAVPHWHAPWNQPIVASMLRRQASQRVCRDMHQQQEQHDALYARAQRARPAQAPMTTTTTTTTMKLLQPRQRGTVPKPQQAQPLQLLQAMPYQELFEFIMHLSDRPMHRLVLQVLGVLVAAAIPLLLWYAEDERKQRAWRALASAADLSEYAPPGRAQRLMEDVGRALVVDGLLEGGERVWGEREVEEIMGIVRERGEWRSEWGAERHLAWLKRLERVVVGGRRRRVEE